VPFDLRFLDNEAFSLPLSQSPQSDQKNRACNFIFLFTLLAVQFFFWTLFDIHYILYVSSVGSFLDPEL